MTRCSSTKKGPCPKHTGTGNHQCKIQRDRHSVAQMPSYEAVLHQCRCGFRWSTSREKKDGKGLARAGRGSTTSRVPVVQPP